MDTKWQRIISSFPNKYHTLLNAIKEKTLILSKEQILYLFEQSLTKWLMTYDRKKKLYVNLISSKVGSEQWLYLTYKDKLPLHTILLRKEQEIEDNSEVIWLDDIIFSGQNALAQIDDLLSERKVKNITYSIITAVCSVVGYSAIKEKEWDVNYYPSFQTRLYYSYTIEPFSNNYKGEKDDTYHEFFKALNLEMEDGAHTFLTDYKIANDFGTYSQIYNKVYSTNRDFMAIINEKWNKFIGKAYRNWIYIGNSKYSAFVNINDESKIYIRMTV